MSLSRWFYGFNFAVVALACNQEGYTLVPEDVYDKNSVYCSGRFEDISSYTKLNNLLSKDDVVGIYKISNTVKAQAQVCFSRSGDGRLTLGSFSGGTPYMLVGKKHIKSCKPGFTLFEGYCLQYDRNPGNISEKVSACSNIGGKLVKVDSAAKQQAVRNFLRSVGEVAVRTYIGLKDMIGDNQLSSYKWMADKSKMVYSHFNANQPDSIYQHCVVLRRNTGYRWTDRSCSNKYAALCEGDYVYGWF